MALQVNRHVRQPSGGLARTAQSEELTVLMRLVTGPRATPRKARSYQRGMAAALPPRDRSSWEGLGHVRSGDCLHDRTSRVLRAQRDRGPANRRLRSRPLALACFIHERTRM